MYEQVEDARAQDSGFCFLCNPFCFSIFDKLVDKVKENVSSPPISQAASGRVKSKFTKNPYKICLDIFPVALLLNQKNFFKKMIS